MPVEHVASREHGPTVLTCAEARSMVDCAMCHEPTTVTLAVLAANGATEAVHARCVGVDDPGL